MLVQHFGTPEEVADNFLSELEPEAMWKHTQLRRKILYLVFAIVLVAASIMLAIQIRTYRMQQEFLDGYVIDAVSYQEDTGNEPLFHMVTPDGIQWEYDKQNGAWEGLKPTHNKKNGE